MKSKFIALILLIFGGICFLTGSYGIYQLYDQSGKMEHTKGVVTHIKTERIYRNRKQIYKHIALIRYQTEHYPTHVRKELHNPFIFQGSEISLWYNPEHTEEVLIPFEDGIASGGTLILGAVCLFWGTVTAKFKKSL